jgi:DNA-directed RNA polymerase specialized sigma24 family protein
MDAPRTWLRLIAVHMMRNARTNGKPAPELLAVNQFPDFPDN